MSISNFLENNYIEYENNSEKIRNLPLDEYLNKIESYLGNIIISLQNSDTWKIQLTIKINFISLKDTEEERVMHENSDKIKFHNKVNDVVNELFKSLLSKYRDALETSMKESDYIFDSVQLWYYKCHKVYFKRVRSYIDSPDWIKKENATTNPSYKDDKCFQCAPTVESNYKETESHPERVSNVKPLINKYDWEKVIPIKNR